MDLDKTFELATNLDRGAIEARLEEVRARWTACCSPTWRSS